MAWILGVAIIAHLLYSELGFNPTDDGFTLAYARRLLDGQIPHRDFIIIRPALSPALHIPEILLGGQFTYWLSRFVFFLQCACIAWFMTLFVNRALCPLIRLRSVDRCVFAIIAFAFCCHSFPAMAWHTIDGLFFCALAFYLYSLSSVRARPIAYLLLGLAYLCKQSFIFVAPGALLLFGDWRNYRNIIAAVLPGILYIAMLGLFGGISDGMQQLLSQTGILDAGVRAYFHRRMLLGVLIGITVTSLMYSKSQYGYPRTDNPVRLFVGCTLVAAMFILATVSLFTGGIFLFSYVLFGIVIGVLIYFVLECGHKRSREIKTGMVVGLLAWCVSLSIGYNTPVLGSGILLVFLFALLHERLVSFSLTHFEEKLKSRWLSAVGVLSAIIVISAFHHVRTHQIYLDRPASELTAQLGDILPGGRLIRTNSNTLAFLSDLDLAIDKVVDRGFEYAIIPDVAAHWAVSKQKNPLPIDWAQEIELNKPELFRRVSQAIEARRHEKMVIVQKLDPTALQRGFFPLMEDKSFHAIVAYVKANLQVVEDTKFFEIYR